MAVVAVAVFGGCRTPAPVVRPEMPGRPVSVSPPVASPGEAAPSGLVHREQIEALLAETAEPIRLRVMAHPLEGDETTGELIEVGQAVLALARGRTRFDADDPMVSPEAAEEARRLGVVPLRSPTSRRSRQPLPMDAEYRALVVAIGRELLVVPQITADRGGMEYQVAEAISRLLHGPRQVGMVMDADRSERLTKLARALDRLDLVAVDLEEPISTELSALVIVGPGKRLKRRAAENLQRFLDQGRSAAFLLEGMKVVPSGKRYRVSRARSGLEDLLEGYGVTIEENLIFDNRCGRVSVPARVGRMMLPYPPIPTVEVEGQEVTPDAREVRLPFPSSLLVRPSEGVEVTTLLQSSDESWQVEGGYDLSPFQQWQRRGRSGPFTFGVVLQRQRGAMTRIAVIGNARFVEDEYLEVAQNALFLRQLVEYLGGHRALSRIISRGSEGGRSGATEAAPDHAEPEAE